MEPVVSPEATLEEITEFFSRDLFAASLNPVIEEARPGYARVSMDIEERHLNAMGGLMGGVTYTLSDFAFAIASNVGQAPAVSASANIEYMSTPKDKHLVAECTIEKNGRSLCFAAVYVRDGQGRIVTRTNITGFRVG